MSLGDLIHPISSTPALCSVLNTIFIYIYIYKSLLFNFHSVHLTGIRTSVKGHLWAYILTYVSTYCIHVEIHHPGKN